jgi:hypothetical protein
MSLTWHWCAGALIKDFATSRTTCVGALLEPKRPTAVSTGWRVDSGSSNLRGQRMSSPCVRAGLGPELVHNRDKMNWITQESRRYTVNVNEMNSCRWTSRNDIFPAGALCRAMSSRARSHSKGTDLKPPASMQLLRETKRKTTLHRDPWWTAWATLLQVQRRVGDIMKWNSFPSVNFFN